MATAPREIVMSTRPPLACWVNVALAPPVRMKLPSCTARTRRIAGSKVSVSVIVVMRAAPLIEIGTVYGPPPTRNVVPGGDSTTCADPIPGDVVGVSAAGGWAATGGVVVAGGGVTAGGVSMTGGGGAAAGGGVVTGGVGGGASTVPGTGVVPGGSVTTAVAPGGGAAGGGFSGGGAISG